MLLSSTKYTNFIECHSFAIKIWLDYIIHKIGCKITSIDMETGKILTFNP